MTDYPHIMGRIFNRPHLIAGDKLRIITAGLAPRLFGQAVPKSFGWDDDADLRPAFPNVPGARKDRREYAVTDRGIAVIPIEGTLCHTSATAAPPSLMTSYTDIRRWLREAVQDATVRRILIDYDTPGGEASDSAYELAEDIRRAGEVKPVWGICDEMACSAGYLNLAPCQRVFAPRGAYVGSIGTYAVLLDMTEFDRKEGLKWEFIKAGDHKTDGNPHVGASQRLRDKLQADVNRTNDKFVAAVVRYRPQLSDTFIRGLQADWFRGEDALRLGLVDGFGSFSEVLEAFSGP